MARSINRLIIGSPKIMDVPPEVLIGNCANALAAHFTDLGENAVQMDQVKLTILGNGRVGKTQLTRVLCGLDMREDDESTHGIDVISHRVFDDETLPTARIWDFGGQDIYHGTHALFMNGRAINLIAWNEISENTAFHEHGGMRFENEKLAYWVEFTRRLSGQTNPLIIVQTYCDKPGSGKIFPPIEKDALEKFDYYNHVNFGAQSKIGLISLKEALEGALNYVPRPLIGEGRQKVKTGIEAIIQDKPDQKFLSFETFESMCAKSGGISDPELFAQYLHHADVVFYRKGLFLSLIHI